MNIFHRSIPAAAGLGALQRIAGALALAALVSGADCLAQALKAEDEVLAENALVKLTRADYETDLQRVPAKMRAEFAANPTRLTMFLNTLLIDKTLARQARDAGLDRDPEISRRLALELDRALRSEERRVGKERRRRWPSDHENRKAYDPTERRNSTD